MTGKLADTVMSVRNGEQIARKYQPMVFNPSTPSQVAQRAKLKLMSQLSAVLGPHIAIPRDGNVSGRNIFTKVNMPLVTYANNQADVTLTDVQITKSIVSLPAVAASRNQTNVYCGLADESADVNHVVYVILAKSGNELRFAGSAIANSATGGDSPWFAQINTHTLDEVVILAYGIRDNNENARTKYGDITAVTAETIAKLIVSRTLTESDITLTETRGQSIAAQTPTADVVDPNTRAQKK